MQAIKPYTQIYKDLDCEQALEKIELIGRVCYKSEDRIHEGSAEKFVANIIKRGHEAVLEHASFIFKVDGLVYGRVQGAIDVLEEETCFKSYLRLTNDKNLIISGNVRAWRDFFKAYVSCFEYLPMCMKTFIQDNPILFPEFQNFKFIKNSRYDEKMVQIKPSDLETTLEKLVHQDVTVKFVIDRGISHEVVRHRPASFCQESTRYCNYSNDKFGKEITCIIPDYLSYGSEAWNVWKNAMKACEDTYFKLLDIGLLPQEARAVLPTSLKTEIVMTANCSEWHHFLKLRTAKVAHPQMREVAIPLLEDLKAMIPVVFDDITY